MKYLLIALLMLMSIVPTEAKRPVARVDAQFSYGFDVTWIRNPHLMRRVKVVSIEWEDGQYFAQVTQFKVGWNGQYGIIYVVPAGILVPNGALITIIK